MADVFLKDVVKNYGKVTAVEQITLSAIDKEFLVLLGPSGCGKTTTLRMIAGLEPVSAGNIFIGGKQVDHLPPKDRDVAMVFQDYALYPHMTVFNNMAFGLRLRKFSQKDISKHVLSAAKILDIENLLERRPKQLSGGQRQRVAIGRAIVRQPQVFLFDEPLSNLDAQLRTQMRAELAKLHHRLQTTIVYVTHDQIEAMTLANRIVIMNKGRIIQIGSPSEVYNQPRTKFVAGFIGSPGMNFLNVKVHEEEGRLFFRNEHVNLLLPESRTDLYRPALSEPSVVFGIRPQHIYEVSTNPSLAHGAPLRTKIEVIEPVGPEVILLTSCGATPVTICVDLKTSARRQAEMDFLIDMDSAHLFHEITGKVY